ncbi:MAG: CHAD domain-containing protein, partial [Roseiarcus sp.]
ILAAADQFPHPGEDEAERIHDVRKTLKAAAGLARLFVPLVGAPAYLAHSAIQAARRSVGRARDLDILPGVLERVKASPRAQNVLLGVIAKQRAAVRRAHRASSVHNVSTELRELAQSVEAWDVGTADVEPLLAAVRRTYRSARARGQKAMASRDAAELHALRARVVDLSHQLRAFEPAWPAMFQAICRELHRLRTALGDHNDLTVLAEFARSRPELPQDEAESLNALIARRRRPLERRAGELFSRLFSERPGAFERRIAAYVERPQHKPRGGRRAALRGSAP